mgnify:CR=1 FL=1
MKKFCEHVGTPARACVTRGMPPGKMRGETQTAKADNHVIFKSKKVQKDNNTASEKTSKNSEPEKIATLIKLVQTKWKNS